MLFGSAGENRCGGSHWRPHRVQRTSPRAAQSSVRWTSFVRGDIFRMRPPRSAKGNEQRGARYGVIVQSDDLRLSTVLVSPTSRSAQARIFRPTIMVGDENTQVLVEQTTAVAPERLGDLVGHVSRSELVEIDQALRLALELD
jgi:mRNA interferase MazF